MGHSAFQPIVLALDGVGQSEAPVVAGALEAGRLAGHARAVVIVERDSESRQRPRSLRLGRRIGEIDQYLLATQGDWKGSGRIEADQRPAAGEVELPIVPVAGD